jgi:acyl carrier protein
MDREELLIRINKVFIDVLDDDQLQIVESTAAEDVDEWDSLNHIHLVVAIEKSLKLRFTASEIQSWANVGEMMNDILKKLG